MVEPPENAIAWPSYQELIGRADLATRNASVTRDGRLIAAEDDVAAVLTWLRARAMRSRSTYDRYQREARRYLACLHTWGLTLADVQIEHVHAYESALRAGHISGRPMTDKGVEAVFQVLASMHNFLAQAGYLSRNVLVLRERQTGSEDTVLERYFSSAELDALLAEIDALDPDAPGTAGARAARVRFCLVWFLSVGARISETLATPMSAVYLAPEGDRMRWVWRARRKGGRTADVPLRDDAVRALAAYRTRLGLTPYPTTTAAPDEGYLVWPLRGRSKAPLHRGTISTALQAFFRRAASRLDDPGLRDHMERGTTHWLRHTAATQLLRGGASLRVVSRLLGHSSVVVTSSIYDHVEREEWRDELDRGRRFD